MVIELIQTYPIVSLILFSIGVTFVSTLATKWLTNQEHMKSLKARQKELQKELKKAKGDEKVIKEIQDEMLSITGKMMKSSFRPLLVTFIPFLILIYWLRGSYEPLLGGWWIGYYLVTSIVTNMILRKLFKMA